VSALDIAWLEAEAQATRIGQLPELWARLKAAREAERGNHGDFSRTLDERAKARVLAQ
jgi:hypothetical protein